MDEQQKIIYYAIIYSNKLGLDIKNAVSTDLSSLEVKKT